MPCASLESGSVRLTLPAGTVCGPGGGGRTAEAPPVLHAPTRAVGLVLRVGVTLDGELLLQTPLALELPLRSGPRDRARLVGPPLIQPLASVAQPPLPALAGRAD